MSNKKKSALGDNIFDFEESVNNINGIEISQNIINTEEKAEEVKQEKKEEKKPKKTEVKKSLETKKEDAPSKEEVERNPYVYFTQSFDDSDKFNKIKKRVMNNFLNTEGEEEQKKNNSLTKHLEKGYIRHTFAIKEEQLKLIRALASYENIEQKELLGILLDKAFSIIDDKTKEEALKRIDTKKEINLFK